MIKISNIDVYNFMNAMRGMRNPLASHQKNDTVDNIIGKTDLKLASKLVRAGEEHTKFLRQIFVSMDIEAPLYWWKEMDQCKIGVTTNSFSTMHTIHKRPLTPMDFSHERLGIPELKVLRYTITEINKLIDKYNETKEKEYWYAIIQLLPSSFNQKRTWTGSYANLLKICTQRVNHKLDEWEVFITKVQNQCPELSKFVAAKKGERL